MGREQRLMIRRLADAQAQVLAMLASDPKHDVELGARMALLILVNAELRLLLFEVLPETMGGTPDLFGPKSGWDDWERRARALLEGRDAT